MNRMRTLPLLALWLSALLLAGCASTTSSSTGQETLDSQARWVLPPVVNNTETPQAGLAAEAMVEHHLRARGVGQLLRYPATLSREGLFDTSERKLVEDAQKWARDQGARYAITGSVEEWRYKIGLDGEPVAGVTLRVIELDSGRVVWSGSGSRSGWSRDGLSAVGQQLISRLLGELRLAAAATPRS